MQIFAIRICSVKILSKAQKLKQLRCKITIKYGEKEISKHNSAFVLMQPFTVCQIFAECDILSSPMFLKVCQQNGI